MRSLWFTVFVTVAFTALGMFLTICGAFALSRKRLKGRKVIGVIFLITMYFTAGTIPDYILMSQLHLINTAAVLILPLAFSAYNLIILRTFMQNSVPQSLRRLLRLTAVTTLLYWLELYCRCRCLFWRHLHCSMR